MTIEGRITICVPFAGDRIGGSHISLKGLLDALPESLYRIIVVPEVAEGKIAAFFGDYEQVADPGALEKPFKVGRSFGIGSALRTLPRAFGRARLLKELGVDIVHTNDGRSHASWALAAKLAGSRMVWHHRGDPDARGTSFVAPIMADQIVSVSEYSLPRRRWGKLREARVIHSPFDVDVSVDREEMRQRLIAELGCPENTIICSYCGQYIVRKRPLAFMDAIAELERIADRPVMGVMFGEPKDDELYAQMQARLQKDAARPPVRLMGYREPGHEWIGACDALLVTALNEPLGRTLVEAMLVGTPVIATSSGGNAEAVAPDCGIIVPLDDAHAMAQAVLDLIDAPEAREALTRRARVMAEKRYTSERHIQQMTEVYRELAGQPPRSGLHGEVGGAASSFQTSAP
ncbi:MAG: glycosyltransferase family 4 protein [Erythrobacter sp.]